MLIYKRQRVDYSWNLLIYKFVKLTKYLFFQEMCLLNLETNVHSLVEYIKNKHRLSIQELLKLRSSDHQKNPKKLQIRFSFDPFAAASLVVNLYLFAEGWNRNKWKFDIFTFLHFYSSTVGFSAQNNPNPSILIGCNLLTVRTDNIII